MNLTIILVHYKSDKNKLKSCIDSINADVEILIIDHSHDLILQDLQIKKDLKIRIIPNKNLGNGAGINCGIKNSKTSYVLYLDVDTILPNDFFLKIRDALNKIENFAVIAPKIKNFYNEEKINKYGNLSKIKFFYNKFFYNIKKTNNHLINIKEVFFISGSIMLINKKLTEQKKIYFDENMFLFFEEDDFFHQCFKSNLKIYLINDLEAFHSDGSIDDNSIEFECFKKWHWEYSKYYFLNKHYNKSLIILLALKNSFKFFIKLLFFYFFNKNKFIIFKTRLNGIFSYYFKKKCKIVF